MADKNHDPQIKVKGLKNKNLVTVKIYDNGTVLIQGSDFLTFCRHDFPIILAKLDNEAGKQEEEQSLQFASYNMQIPTVSPRCEDDDILQDLDESRSPMSTSSNEVAQEEIVEKSPIKSDLKKKLNVQIPVFSNGDLMSATGNEVAQEEITEQSPIKNDLKKKLNVQIPGEIVGEELDSKDTIINMLQEEVKNLQGEKYKLYDNNATLEFELQAAKKCSEAKDNEILGLRKKMSNNKMEAKASKDELAAYKSANDLLIADLEAKEADARRLKQTVQQQKKEI